jgi:hypothetical protein
VRYARPRCEECVRLAAEYEAFYQEWVASRDELKMTRKDDRAYLERRKHLDKVAGQLREALRRDQLHEKTHQDEFSWSTTKRRD